MVVHLMQNTELKFLDTRSEKILGFHSSKRFKSAEYSSRFTKIMTKVFTIENPTFFLYQIVRKV